MSERKTKTFPDSERPTGVGEPIIGLRLPDTHSEFMLAPDQDVFRVGSASDCDLVINNPYTSSVHCVLQRRERGIVLVDQGSKNGTFRKGHRCEQFELEDLVECMLGTTTLVPFSAKSQRTRRSFERLIGYSAARQRDVDAFMRATLPDAEGRDPHILLVGEPGSRRGELARVIHASSPRATRRFVELAEVPATGPLQNGLLKRKQNEGSTFFLHQHVLPAERSVLMRASERNTYDVRLIAATTDSGDAAVTAFGPELYRAMLVLAVPPLRERREDIPRLIDATLAPLPAKRSIAQRNVAALTNYDWPGNLDELLETVPLVAAVEHIGVRKAAKELGIDRSKVSRRMKQLGFTRGSG